MPAHPPQLHQARPARIRSNCPLPRHFPPLQVRLKANALVQFMGAQHGAQRTYALLTLANKLISQCEVQVGVLGSGKGA